MDPNKALAEILDLCRKLDSIDLLEDSEPSPAQEELEAVGEMGQSLAQKVQNLDEWIRKGGALPQEWQPKPIEDRIRKDATPFNPSLRLSGRVGRLLPVDAAALERDLARSAIKKG